MLESASTLPWTEVLLLVALLGVTTAESEPVSFIIAEASREGC
jgi:hypothetical protein